MAGDGGPVQHLRAAPARGGGKRLLDCDDQELAALAILLHADIAKFREAAQEARAEMDALQDAALQVQHTP